MLCARCFHLHDISFDSHNNSVRWSIYTSSYKLRPSMSELGMWRATIWTPVSLTPGLVHSSIPGSPELMICGGGIRIAGSRGHLNLPSILQLALGFLLSTISPYTFQGWTLQLWFLVPHLRIETIPAGYFCKNRSQCLFPAHKLLSTFCIYLEISLLSESKENGSHF